MRSSFSNKIDQQFEKCLKIFLLQMPEQILAYTKFLKLIMSKKRKLEDFKTVALTEKCSAIIQNKLHHCQEIQGVFTIGDVSFYKDLCDLDASISQMPFYVSTKLGLKELKPTAISL